MRPRRSLPSSAATLRKKGIKVVEFPQTTGNLTRAGQGLYELVKGRNLCMYEDAELRSHALAAVAVETGRGWRLAKEKASRKIAAVVALSFACLDTLERQPGVAASFCYRCTPGHPSSGPNARPCNDRGGPVTIRGDLELVGARYVDRASGGSMTSSRCGG